MPFCSKWPGTVIFILHAGHSVSVSDGTPVILISVLMFMLPAKLPKWQLREGETHSGETLLDWKSVHNRVSWNVLILLGGGFALAKGAKVTCLSTWIGDQLSSLQVLLEQQAFPYVLTPFILAPGVSPTTLLLVHPHRHSADPGGLQLGHQRHADASVEGARSHIEGIKKL